MQDLLGSLGPHIRILLDAGTQRPVILLQTLQMHQQLLQIPLQSLISPLDLLIVMLVHLPLPIHLLLLLHYVRLLKLLSDDQVLQLGGLELRAGEFFFFGDDVLFEGFCEGIEGGGCFCQAILLFSHFGDLVVAGLDSELEIQVVVIHFFLLALLSLDFCLQVFCLLAEGFNVLPLLSVLLLALPDLALEAFLGLPPFLQLLQQFTLLEEIFITFSSEFLILSRKVLIGNHQSSRLHIQFIQFLPECVLLNLMRSQLGLPRVQRHQQGVDG